MTTVERILAEARTLPLIEQIRLSRLLAQEALAATVSADASLALDSDDGSKEARRRAIRQVRGSMAGLLPSTEAFLAEKHAELEAEERKLAERIARTAEQPE